MTSAVVRSRTKCGFRNVPISAEGDWPQDNDVADKTNAVACINDGPGDAGNGCTQRIKRATVLNNIYWLIKTYCHFVNYFGLYLSYSHFFFDFLDMDSTFLLLFLEEIKAGKNCP